MNFSTSKIRYAILFTLLTVTAICNAGKVNYDSTNRYQKDGVIYGFDFIDDNTRAVAWVLELSPDLDLSTSDGVLEIPAECNYDVKVIAIAKDAFKGREDLKSIKLPNTIEELPAEAFLGCKNLESIEIDPMNPYMLVRDGIVWARPKSESFLDTILYGALVPVSELSLKNVSYIVDNAFSESRKLQSLTIANSISANGEKTGLSTLQIGETAFQSCPALSSLSIGADSIAIGKSAFVNCPALSSLSLKGNSKIQIGDSAFQASPSLSSISINANSKIQIGKSAFESCPAISSIKFATDSIAIADSAFMDCKALTDISFKAKKKSGYYETTNYYQKNIPNPSEIGKRAFVGCSALKNIDINGSITIGEECFAGCLGIDKVTINGDVIKLNSMAFKDCENLAELNFNIIDGAQQDYKLILGNQVFWGVKHLDRLYIPFPFTCGYSNFAGMTVDDVQLSPQSVLAFLEDDYLIIKRVTENLNYNLKPIYDYRKAIVANFKPREEVVIPLDIWGIDNGMWLNSPDLKAIYLNPDVIVTPQKKLPEMTMAPESVLESCTLYTRTTIEKLYPFGRPFNTYNYNYFQSCDAVERCYDEPNPWEKFKKTEQLTSDMDQYDGIAEIEAENATVITNNGTIIVEGAEGKQVSVYSADGRLLYRGPAGPTGVAGHGIYIVTIGATSVKVAL